MKHYFRFKHAASISRKKYTWKCRFPGKSCGSMASGHRREAHLVLNYRILHRGALLYCAEHAIFGSPPQSDQLHRVCSFPSRNHPTRGRQHYMMYWPVICFLATRMSDGRSRSDKHSILSEGLKGLELSHAFLLTPGFRWERVEIGS